MREVLISLFCNNDHSQNHISSHRNIGRKTYSLLATRSHLVIIKVFRFQRKTLLFSFGFFFSIIIKVFRLQRKTLLLFFGFFFTFIIIIIIIFILFSSYKICAEDFSEMARSINLKFSGKVCRQLNLIHFSHFFENHFRSEVIAL